MEKKSKTLLAKFVFSYIIVLTLVFLVTGTFNFTTSVRMARDETLTKGQNILDTGRSAIDSKINALQSLSVPLISKDKVLDVVYMRRPFPHDSSLVFSEINQRLSAYAMMSDFVDIITLYYQNNRLFISNRSAGVYYDAYYNAWMQHYGSGFEEWDEILNRSDKKDILAGYRKDGAMMIDIINRLPTSSKVPIYMILTLDGRVFSEFFENLNQYEDSFFCVVGPDGEIYYSGIDLQTTMTFLDTENENKDYLVFRSKSNEVDFEYVAFIPQKSLYTSELRFIRDFIIIYVLLVLFSLILFTFLSYKNILPLRKVVEKIAVNQGLNIDKSKSEAELIGTAFTDILYGMENQKLSARENFFSKLLSGGSLTERDILSLDAHCTKVFHYDQYLVVAIKAVNREEYGTKAETPSISQEQIAGLLTENVFAHSLNNNTLALIFCFNHNHLSDDMEKVLEQYIAEFDKCGIDVICAVGDSKSLSDQIYISCQNACWLLRTFDAEDKRQIYWYTDIALDSDGFYYPEESQRRLANLILAGESQAATEEITNLYEINFNAKRLTDQEKNYFTDALIYDFVILKKTINLLNPESEEHFHYMMNLARKNPYPESNLPYFIILARLLAGCAEVKKSSQEKALLDKIIDYVGENFGNPELCLATVAENLGLQEYYVSLFFKQGTGEKLSSYIEDIRMHNAVRYITDSSYTIKEVAEMSGYSNINTFYKAFKRKFGVPPKTYQQNLKMQDTDKV